MINKGYTQYLGNELYLNNHIIAYLCSGRYSTTAVLRSYDWANTVRNRKSCIISGFHSVLEKDVLKILLNGTCPICMVLARGMYKKLDPTLKEKIDCGRLLLITPFKSSVTYVTKETAIIRNRLVIELADEIVVAHITPGGKLEQQIKDAKQGKIVTYL